MGLDAAVEKELGEQLDAGGGGDESGDHEERILDAGCWILDVWVMAIGCECEGFRLQAVGVQNIGCWMLDTGCVGYGNWVWV
jgi:hypothetical protein